MAGRGLKSRHPCAWKKGGVSRAGSLARGWEEMGTAWLKSLGVSKPGHFRAKAIKPSCAGKQDFITCLLSVSKVTPESYVYLYIQVSASTVSL